MCAAAHPPTEPTELEIGEITPVLPVVERETVSSRALEFRIKAAREVARGFLAFILALIFGLTVYWAFGNVGTSRWTDTEQLLDVLIPVESALLGNSGRVLF